MGALTAGFIDAQAARMCRSRHVHGAVPGVDQPAGPELHPAAAADLAPGARFCAASTTKLIVTIVTMQLVEAGRLSLDAPLAAHLPAGMIAGLHRRKGVEHTGRITLRHLIANQTGLRDCFSLKGADGRRPADRLLAGEGSAWPLARVLQAVRGSEAQFLPASAARCLFRHQLPAHGRGAGARHRPAPAGAVRGRGLRPPRAARQLHLHRPVRDAPGVVLRWRAAAAPAASFQRPRRMTAAGASAASWTAADARGPVSTRGRRHHLASVPAEGGMATTAADLAAIGRAVFEGRLFDIAALLAQQDWRMIFWPGQFRFGLGLERLWTPWFLAPLRPIRDVTGFRGQTGAFVFHPPGPV